MENDKIFDFFEVTHYLEKVSSSDLETVILVGGQALNAWAEIYLQEDHDLYPFASKDLDFLASDMKVMKKLAETLNGKYLLNKEDISTHVGIVTITNGQKTIQADVLSAVHGLDTQEIRKRVVKLEFEGFQCNIMHPVHCFIS